MFAFYYSPLTAEDVALALAFSDDEGFESVNVAQDMLDGVVRFTREELEKLAAFRNVTLEYLTENDPALKRYADKGMETRKSIALNILRKCIDVEFAAEVCELPLEMVRKLR